MRYCLSLLLFVVNCLAEETVPYQATKPTKAVVQSGDLVDVSYNGVVVADKDNNSLEICISDNLDAVARINIALKVDVSDLARKYGSDFSPMNEKAFIEVLKRVREKLEARATELAKKAIEAQRNGPIQEVKSAEASR